MFQLISRHVMVNFTILTPFIFPDQFGDPDLEHLWGGGGKIQITGKKSPGYFQPGESYREAVRGEGGQAPDESYNPLWGGGRNSMKRNLTPLCCRMNSVVCRDVSANFVACR